MLSHPPLGVSVGAKVYVAYIGYQIFLDSQKRDQKHKGMKI